MRHEIAVMTGSRADYGLLRQLLFRLRGDTRVRLTLLVTGSHLSAAFGNTQQEIEADGFGAYMVRLPIPLEDDTKGGMAASAGAALSVFAAYFREHRPRLLIVLGDRYEAFSAASAAYLCGVPVAHISGGDVTEGAVDDGLRNCITMLSSLHFPGCAQSAARIIQMGKPPETVFNVGEPGVENCLRTELLSREALRESLAFDGIAGDYAVVTFHPATAEDDTALAQLRELIAAMDTVGSLSYVITTANADAGGRAVNELWRRESEGRSNWLVVPSLGVTRYLSALKYAKMTLGNSSSGIVEAPAMKLPSVNIGDRQKGRMLAESVLCCAPERGAIISAMRKALSAAFQAVAQDARNPFGDGRTSEKIHAAVAEFWEKN